MCGLAGIARREPVGEGIPAAQLRRMTGAIRHRGPDGEGWTADDHIGLAHVRLSVIDPAGGAQPMENEDGSVRVVCNGEIFNFAELRRRLESRGHAFRTRSDTEVLVHGWEEWGEALLPLLNGQFACAIADRRAGEPVLFLARDRFGILPLYYAERDGDLYFASEIKALFAGGAVPAEPDPVGLDQVFTFWAARPPRTAFRGVQALEPGCSARWSPEGGRLTLRRWYAVDFPEAAEEPARAVADLDALLRSAVGLRLTADVPVGAYLSGGLDSSAVCTLAAAAAREPLRTLSVTFGDPRFDESDFQRLAASRIGSRHAARAVGDADIARVFPAVVWHAETPLLRTAPAPLYLLSRLAREQGISVVLSGEGSDEIFFGYELFRDTAVRLFCGRRPESRLRPRLLDRLYPAQRPGCDRGPGAGEFWRAALLGAGPSDDPLFSHLPRFRLSARIKEFYTPDFRAALREVDALAQLRDELPAAFARWSPLARASYLEMTTLLSPCLLASQGDRMAMAHGVELRVPFLDHRLVEFAAALPGRSKLLGLQGKAILRRWARGTGLPPPLARRPKQAYRAPDVPPFFRGAPPEYVAELLDPQSLARTGIFDPGAVAGLVRRCREGRAAGARESQALVAVLSTELWHHQFLTAAAAPARAPAAA